MKTKALATKVDLSLVTERQWLCLIIVVGILIKLLVIMKLGHIPQSDELAYQGMALNLINGKGIVDGLGNHAMYNVGYPLFVLAPVFAVFGEGILAVQVINTILGGLSILLCSAIAKEAGANKAGRLLSAALWATYLPASVYVVYLLKENLMIPLMLGVVWCALRLQKEPAYPIGLGCGVLLGLLAVTGNAALVLLVPVLSALMLASGRPLRKLAVCLIILGAASLMAAPWMIRNKQVLGSYVLNTNGGFNLYLGNNPEATGWFVSISDTPRGSSWEQLRKEGEAKASDTLKNDAITWIKTHPAEFFKLAFNKARYFWTPRPHKGERQSSRIEAAVRAGWTIEYIVLVTAAIGSLMPANLRNRSMAVLWLAIGGYTMVHMVFYVIFRYREPIMPLVCILAACCFESLSRRLNA